MSRAFCQEGEHYPKEIVASTYHADGTEAELGVLLDNEGMSTNRWEDGTVGVGDVEREFAESDDSAMCPEHYCEVRWDHSGYKED